MKLFFFFSSISKPLKSNMHTRSNTVPDQISEVDVQYVFEAALRSLFALISAKAATLWMYCITLLIIFHCEKGTLILHRNPALQRNITELQQRGMMLALHCFLSYHTCHVSLRYRLISCTRHYHESFLTSCCLYSIPSLIG